MVDQGLFIWSMFSTWQADNHGHMFRLSDSKMNLEFPSVQPLVSSTEFRSIFTYNPQKMCQQIRNTNRHHISYKLRMTVISCIHTHGHTNENDHGGRRGSSQVSMNLVICVSLYLNIFMGVDTSDRYMIEMHRVLLLTHFAFYSRVWFGTNQVTSSTIFS